MGAAADPLPPLPPCADLAVPDAVASAVAGRLAIPTAGGGLLEVVAVPGGFRLRAGPRDLPDYGILAREPDVLPAAIEESPPGTWRLSCGDLRLEIEAATLRLALWRGGARLLGSADDRHFTGRFRFPAIGRAADGWMVALALESGGAVYGIGEKWGRLDRRGQILRSENHDALGVNREVSYKNCPFAWSPAGWGVFVHTPANVVHGVGHAAWSHRSYLMLIDDAALDLFLLADADGAGVIGRYTALTGRSPALPLWSLGAWMSRAYYRTPGEMLTEARRLRDTGTPMDVITLDGRAWQDTGTRFAFEWDPSRYHDPKAVVDSIHALDLKLCCWEYPLVSCDSPLHARMAEKGWLLGDDRDGEPYRYRFDPEPFGTELTQLPDSGLVDFTHPEAYAFWRDCNRALVESGVDVVKSDFGEQVETHCRAANGDGCGRLRNVYALLYNRCVHEATVAARGAGDALVFGRAGWAGSQRYPMQWGGDPECSWEGLAASIRGGLSWGMSGVPFYASDIGGFYGGPPGDTLYLRWTQAGVFHSHMRFHGIGPREPHHFAPGTAALARRFIDLRYRLLPYVAGAVEIACDTGLPVMRAMPLAFPDDRAAWAFEEQWMFGPDILVVPVLREDGRVTLHLPAGSWHDLWTGEVIDGPRTLTRIVPLDRIPLFLRAGAVLPLGPSVRHTGELGGAPRVVRLLHAGMPLLAPCLPAGVTADAAVSGAGPLDDGEDRP